MCDQVLSAYTNLGNKFDNRGCIQFHWTAAVPLLMLLCEIQRLQMPRDSSKYHLALLTIEVVVKQLIPDMTSAAALFVTCSGTEKG